MLLTIRYHLESNLLLTLLLTGCCSSCSLLIREEPCPVYHISILLVHLVIVALRNMYLKTGIVE